jgi:hypothetical protein
MIIYNLKSEVKPVILNSKLPVERVKTGTFDATFDSTFSANVQKVYIRLNSKLK